MIKLSDTMKKEIVDQSAHFLAAIVALLVASIFGAELTVFAGAALGLTFGLIREITEGDPVTSRNSLLDILFWVLGGTVGGYLF